MTAFENEKLILESDNKQIRLTSHRIRYYQTPKRNSDFTSLMIDKISSIELTYYKSSIWLLIIGVVTIPILVGLILIYMFFTSKRHVVAITPDGGKPVLFETNGMKRDFLDNFIDEIELASMRLKNKID
jgi:hypothetical protein